MRSKLNNMKDLLPGGYSFNNINGKRIELIDSCTFGTIVVVTPHSFIYVKMDNGENVYIDPLNTKFKIK